MSELTSTPRKTAKARHYRGAARRKPSAWPLLLPICLLFVRPSAADEFPPLFPFLISYDAPDNASSMAHLLDPPAGKHGFIRVKDGRFVDDSGPVRLHATNLTGPANFPTHAQADRLAARLAHFGLNCVRLHYMDGKYKNFIQSEKPCITTDEPTTQRNLDSGQLDKLDYLIAALKRRGIYVNINLHVARQWDGRDGFPATPGRPGMDKGLDNFEPRMVELQKEYARKLLSRVNPYTGLPYPNDPCVAMVEINNENALFRWYFMGEIDRLPEPYAGEFRRQWNDWLRKRYDSTTALKDAWRWETMALGDEQVPEGGFDGALAIDGAKWILAPGSSKTTCETGGGVLKIKVSGDGGEFFPKLFRTISVKKDRHYTLSFKIRCGEGTKDAKLGLAVADTKGGWRSLGVHQVIQVGQNWKVVEHVFQAADDSDKAQVQLTRFKPGTYEVDALSFRIGASTEFDAAMRLEDGTIPAVKHGRYAPPQAVRDFYQFMVDTEKRYWVGMSDYLKNELDVRSVISGTQLGYSPPYVQAELDYIDSHSYWCHPSPVDPQWRIGNEPMVNSMSCILGLAGQRVLGKPYTVSEYNHPFPNQYGAEGQPMLRAYGRLHGWDGVFQYTYNHEPDFEPTHNTYFFSMIARAEVLAHMPACAAIYLRGDVREAGSTTVGATDYASYFDRLTRSKSVGATIGSLGLDPRLALSHKTAVDLGGAGGAAPAVTAASADQKLFVSDTGELTWNIEQPGAGYWIVDTPNTKLFTGFPKGRTIKLGDVTLAIGRTRLDWATVSMVSRHATGFGRSSGPASILLAATGLAQNKGMAIEKSTPRSIRLSDWGGGAVCMEGIPATIILPTNPARLRCFALGPDGERKNEIPPEKTEDGSMLTLKPEYQTVWYEIEVKAATAQ